MSKKQISRKSNSELVKTIDELKKAKPNFSVLSEEIGFKKSKDTENTWIIDPIDGTINFLHGIPHFAISIALKNKDEIISGLIFDPIKPLGAVAYTYPWIILYLTPSFESAFK